MKSEENRKITLRTPISSEGLFVQGMQHFFDLAADRRNSDHVQLCNKRATPETPTPPPPDLQHLNHLQCHYRRVVHM